MQKSLLSAVAMATTSLLAFGAAAPATAQVRQAIAVVDVERAIGQSAAATTAGQQMQVTYKAQIDQLNARQSALQTELQQKQQALQAAVQAAGEHPTAAQQTQLQTQYDALQRRAQEAQQELQRINQPIALAREYVLEQINAKLDEALRSVMTKNRIDLLVKAAAADAYQPSADVTNQLVQELNTLVPSVSIVPPQGWRPGGQGQQQGQAAPPPAAGTTPPPQPEGR